jgi:hypothetical protein
MPVRFLDLSSEQNSTYFTILKIKINGVIHLTEQRAVKQYKDFLRKQIFLEKIVFVYLKVWLKRIVL